MGDENPIRTLGNYSKPSHEGNRNSIALHVGNNVVPLRSDTIRLLQNRCSFHGLQSEDPNQHLKDFLKLVDSHDLDYEYRERTCLRLFQIPFAIKLATSLIIFQQDPSPPGRILLLNLYREHGLVSSTCYKKSLIMASTFGSKSKFFMTMSIPSQDEPLTDRPVPVKAITLPQDVPSTSDRLLIELKNQVQCLMEAHLAPTQPTQVNKITTSCEIYSGPYDTQYCMEDLEQAFVEYASLRIDEAG
nr:MAK10-like protein [Tanacetum cinerariifolium]